LASLRRAFAAQPQQTPDLSQCPPPEKIWDAVRGALPADEIAKIVQHTVLCAACAEDWRLAHALQGKEMEAAAPATVLPFVPRRHLVRNWSLAAAAVLALCVVGVQLYERQPGTAAYRESQPASGIRSRVPDGKPLPRDRFVLSWSAPAPAGVTYGVQVSTEDLRVVANAEGLKAPEYQVPATALAGLPAGSRLLWRVDADFSDGSRLTSPTFVTLVR
jgi:hypothetical protein